MRDWKKAFGQPDDGFTLRVQQTLLAIEEKEKQPVKKKLTVSLAFACILFVTVLAVSALAASNLLSGRPDETIQPLSQGAIGAQPTPTPMPMPDDEALTVVPVTMVMAENGQGGNFHQSPDCERVGEAFLPMPVTEAIALGKQPCPICCDGHISEWVTMVDENGSAIYKRALDVYGSSWQIIMRAETVVVAFSGDGDREHYHEDLLCDQLGEYAEVMVRMTRQEALELGYEPCAECVGKTVEEQIDQAMPTPMPMPLSMSTPTSVAATDLAGCTPYSLFVRANDTNGQIDEPIYYNAVPETENAGVINQNTPNLAAAERIFNHLTLTLYEGDEQPFANHWHFGIEYSVMDEKKNTRTVRLDFYDYSNLVGYTRLYLPGDAGKTKYVTMPLEDSLALEDIYLDVVARLKRLPTENEE